MIERFLVQLGNPVALTTFAIFDCGLTVVEEAPVLAAPTAILDESPPDRDHR
jgi:hypothetical protein